jgi:hypothetical protein
MQVFQRLIKTGSVFCLMLIVCVFIFSPASALKAGHYYCNNSEKIDMGGMIQYPEVAQKKVPTLMDQQKHRDLSQEVNIRGLYVEFVTKDKIGYVVTIEIEMTEEQVAKVLNEKLYEWKQKPLHPGKGIECKIQ